MIIFNASAVIELHKKLLTLNQEMAIMIVVRMKNLTEKTAESEDKDLTQIAKTSAFYDDFLKFFQQNILFIPQDAYSGTKFTPYSGQSLHLIPGQS